MVFPLPTPHPAELLGRPSRKAAAVVMKAHLAIVRGGPLKRSLSEALQDEPSLGGQERRFAAFATRELSRHMRYLDLVARLAGCGPGSQTLQEDQVIVRYAFWRKLFTGVDAARTMVEAKLPGPLRPRSIKDAEIEAALEAALPDTDMGEGVERAATLHSFPRWLSEQLATVVPPEEVDPLFAALNREPSLILRARVEGGAAEAVRKLEEEGVRAEPLGYGVEALRVLDPGNRVFEAKLMKAGGLQVQDLGSQLIAELCRPEPGWEGAKIADVCAGAAGKSIALADRVGASGKIYAGDNSPKRLREGRARVQTMKLGARVAFPHELPLSSVDAVLIDAPCSGTGSLAREPDQKWKLSKKRIDELVEIQTTLLRDAAAKVKPGAVIVYATCSLLREENEAVVERVAAEAGLTITPAESVLGRTLETANVFEGPYLRAFPHRVPGGGFFAARLVK